MFQALIDFIFPRTCVGCGSWGEYLCPDCVNFLRTIDKPICPYCSQGAIYGQTHFSCRQAWGLEGLTSIFVYQGIVKEIITKLKYHFATDLSETILEMFLSFCGEDKALTKFVLQKNVCLVPVPLHWWRRNWRGFNQAELLGQMIAEKLDIGFLPDLLIRKKYTRPQIKFKKEKRIKNIKGAFKINHQSLAINHPPAGGSIILFDDVWTTGATMKECAKLLKSKGIKKVWGLTLAR